MSECSNHNGTTITPLADTLTGFDSSTLKSCPFCGFKSANLVLFDEEGYVISDETWDNECGDEVRRNEDGDADPEELIAWAKKNLELYVDHYGIECFECGATVYGHSPDFAKGKWNRRAYPIEEWRSAFAPSEGIQ